MKPQNHKKSAGNFKNSKQTNKFDAGYSKKSGNSSNKRDTKKPVFKNVRIPIAYSDFYANTIDSLYNLLESITFNMVSIPAKMSKAEFNNDDSLRGNMIVGTIVEYNKDNTLTISMTEDSAAHVTEDMVVGIRCRKDYNTNEVNYISEFTITKKYESIEDHFKDINDAFKDGETSAETEAN